MYKLHLKSGTAAFLLLGLFGCASSPTGSTFPSGEATEDAGQTEGRVIKENDNIPVNSTEAEEPTLPPQTPVLARDLSQEEVDVEQELPAVAYLLNQAQSALDKNDLDRASALADRALKIDRKSARTYLILALVEISKGRPDQASQLAKQGLLYTSENSNLSVELKQIL